MYAAKNAIIFSGRSSATIGFSIMAGPPAFGFPNRISSSGFIFSPAWRIGNEMTLLNCQPIVA